MIQAEFEAPSCRERVHDYVLVGGGLQSGLLALAIRHHQPHASVAMIERDADLGGNHTWSFHLSDIAPAARTWLDPLIAHRWRGYDVSLPRFSRHVALPYASIPSARFSEVIRSLFLSAGGGEPPVSHDHRSVDASSSVGLSSQILAEPVGSGRGVATSETLWQLYTNCEVKDIRDSVVSTDCGLSFRGRCVIDCRGPGSQRVPFSGLGFQKFYGFELELEEDWPLEVPLIMDAAEDQTDGFRFFYSLPFTARRVLVEDTRFSDSPLIDRQECLAKVRDYLAARGIKSFEIVREESGVLPMPFSTEGKPAESEPLAGGYAGGWFHAATGYSFPMAVAFAETVASAATGDTSRAVRRLATGHRFQASFSRFLNRLLFRLVDPVRRHRVFRRFYRVLDDEAVARFYSHRFSRVDAFRIVIGVPPTILGLRPLRFVRSFFVEGPS